jgi:WhiB family transcriptional regulator, redox-sensing transcriptional regulator
VVARSSTVSEQTRGLIDKAYELTSRERKLVFKMLRWAPKGACQEKPDPGFLAERTNSGSKNREQEQTAKAICGSCPVRAECLEHAILMPETGGIWGGLNSAERFLVRKQWLKMNPGAFE